MSRRYFLQASAGAALSGRDAVFGAMSGTARRGFLDDPAVFPAWRPGLLDLHHINTGRGNAALLACPDGTSVLVDAGAANSAVEQMNPARPDDSRRAGEWVARYARRHLRAAGRDERLDYAVATHLHGDHVGEVSAASPLVAHGGYRLTGLMDVAEQMHIGLLIDRGYPAYDFPVAAEDATAKNYVAFARQRGARAVEQVKVGSTEQMRLRYARGHYPKFSVRAVAGNGEVWTGKGAERANCFPPLAGLTRAQMPTENMCSIALRVEYGAFSYFTGSDLTCDTGYGAAPWRDVETLAGRASGPVSVATVNHHGYYDANGAEFVRAMRPKAWVLQAWHASHPDMGVLARLMSPELERTLPAVFAVGLKPEVAVTEARFVAMLQSKEGHVVVRVAEGGASFEVFVLTDRDESGRVLGRFGPYAS